MTSRSDDSDYMLMTDFDKEIVIELYRAYLAMPLSARILFRKKLSQSDECKHCNGTGNIMDLDILRQSRTAIPKQTACAMCGGSGISQV